MLETVALIVSVIALLAAGIEIYLNHFQLPPYARVYVSEYGSDADPPEGVPPDSPETEWLEIVAVVANPRKSDLLVKHAGIYEARDYRSGDIGMEVSVSDAIEHFVRVPPGALESISFKIRMDVAEEYFQRSQRTPVLHMRLLTPKGEAALDIDIADVLNEQPGLDLWQIHEVKKLGAITLPSK